MVFREEHSVPGTFHFHIAVSLHLKMRFASVAQTLRARHGLRAHFSKSHAEFWSACRYGAFSTGKKRSCALDSEPLAYEGANKVPQEDVVAWLYEHSQEPWSAQATDGRCRWCMSCICCIR